MRSSSCHVDLAISPLLTFCRRPRKVLGKTTWNASSEFFTGCFLRRFLITQVFTTVNGSHQKVSTHAAILKIHWSGFGGRHAVEEPFHLQGFKFKLASPWALSLRIFDLIASEGRLLLAGQFTVDRRLAALTLQRAVIACAKCKTTAVGRLHHGSVAPGCRPCFIKDPPLFSLARG